MLRISKMTDYAVLVLDFLAKHHAQLQSSRQIAKVLQVNLPTISKLLKVLNRAGLVAAMRGVEGGYRLAKSADAISMADVIAAVEGAPGITECSTVNKRCLQDGHCTLRHNWQLVNRMFIEALANLSVADMSRPLLSHALIQQGIGFEKLTEVVK